MSEAAQEPSMKRRCFVHDYKSRSIYLVTLEVAGRQPRLGRINAGLTPRAPNRPAAGPGAFQEAGVIGEAGQNGALPPLAMGLPGEATFGGERVSASSLSEAELREMNAGLFEPSELGRRVVEEFMKIGEHVAGVKPIIAQAMPDHFHGVLFVTRAIDRSLGSIIAGFKGRCSQIAGQLGRTPEPPNRRGDWAGRLPKGANVSGEATLGGERVRASLWEPGYHDRILTSEGQLEKMIRYVIDNPRRAALRLRHRDLFTNVRRLAGRGRAFDAYGNGFLLQRAEIVQVQCSRRFFGFKRVEKLGQPAGRNWRVSKIARNAAGEAVAAFETPEFAAKREALFAAAKRGAVLCSPCISDGERALAYAAVDAGCPLIVLRNEPFPPRFKPSGRFFDACAEGRLLMLHPLGLTAGAPNRPAAGRGASAPAITRGECLALNAIAAEICGGDAGEIVYYGLT